MENWFVFYHGNKELCAYTVRGTFEGELESTKELLAYENGVHVNEISVAIEKR